MGILKGKDRLFYLGLFTFFYWLADTYYKIFILSEPSKLFWYSSVGLFFVSVGLFRRSSLLLTAMFCMLVINESIWTLSFFSNLLLKNDIFYVASYAFNPQYPKLGLFITMYHLALVPSAIIGLITIKKIHKFGWFLAFVVALTFAYLAYFFPDSKENINCIQRVTKGSCELYFSFLYNYDKPLRIFLAAILLMILVYIPINILLLKLAKKLKWQ